MLKTSEGRMIPCFCITNRKLCQDDFIERIKRIVDGQKADAVILREKDLPEEEYLYLAGQVLDI